MLRSTLRLGLTAFSLIISACASVAPGPTMVRSSGEARACADWFAALDKQVEAAGVRDAGSHRVVGHPYLRADRFSASFRELAQEAGPAFDTWVLRLRELDRTARDVELQQLAPDALAPLAASRTIAMDKVNVCGLALIQEDLASSEGRARLQRLAVVPDDYAQWVHTSGIYAVSSIPFSMGVKGWYREAQAMFDQAAAGTAYTTGIRHVEPAGPLVSAADVRAVFARTSRDALGVPRFSRADESRLFRAYAPRYEIETRAPYDRFGALAWAPDVATPQVDTNRPVTYQRMAFTRLQGRVLTQLSYTVWFPERPRSHPLDLLGGSLDGLVMRVTLDDDGTPLVWDSIHPCGCYHMFFPTPALQQRAAPPASQEWALIPSRLPAMAPADRVAVRIASGSHDLVAVTPTANAGGAAAVAAKETYTLLDEDDLRTLPWPQGGVRSIYGPDALVAGTERGERLFFWPMGIKSPGTMRQWGRHPTAFLDRRHFDDADLLDKRFAPADGRTLQAQGTTRLPP